MDARTTMLHGEIKDEIKIVKELKIQNDRTEDKLQNTNDSKKQHLV